MAGRDRFGEVGIPAASFKALATGDVGENWIRVDFVGEIGGVDGSFSFPFARLISSLVLAMISAATPPNDCRGNELGTTAGDDSDRCRSPGRGLGGLGLLARPPSPLPILWDEPDPAPCL